MHDELSALRDDPFFAGRTDSLNAARCSDALASLLV
jgi:hypothetical protein